MIKLTFYMSSDIFLYFFLHIKVSKHSSAKYFQNNKEDYKKAR